MSITGPLAGLGLVAGIGAAGSVAGGVIGAVGANAAAGTQASAAEQAAALQAQEAQNALNFQEQEFQTTQGNLQPYLQGGYAGLANLENLLGILPPSSTSTAPVAGGAPAGAPSLTPDTGPSDGIPGARTGTTLLPGGGNAPSISTTGVPASVTNLNSLVNPALGARGSLAAPWTGTFQAPTEAQARATPGYQFAFDQGINALNSSGAAQGNLLSGGTLKGFEQFGQGLADTNYQNVFNNSLQQYQTAYNTFENNQNNLYNRLAAASGLGQVAGSQLGQFGQGAANNVSNLLLGAGGQIGQNINNIGAANASGYVGAANALGGGLSGGLNNYAQLIALQSILNPQANPGTQAGAGIVV